jgi:hypothetical protein
VVPVVKRTEITVDAHGRTVLGFRKHKYKKYWAEERESGTIILTPAEPALVRATVSGKDPLEEVSSKILPVDEIKDRVRETALWQERT